MYIYLINQKHSHYKWWGGEGVRETHANTNTHTEDNIFDLCWKIIIILLALLSPSQLMDVSTPLLNT